MPGTVLGTPQIVISLISLEDAMPLNIQVKRQRLALVQGPRAGILTQIN